MSIKRREKRRLLQTAALLMRANEKSVHGIWPEYRRSDDRCAFAISGNSPLVGNRAGNVGKADLVPLLEVYCEDLFMR